MSLHEIFTGIKHSLNSTLGTDEFAPLDQLIKSQTVDLSGVADKVTQNSIKSLIGTTSDIGGGYQEGSVNAKLNALVNSVGNYGTTLDAINTNVNNANTTLGTIGTNINTISNNVNSIKSTVNSDSGVVKRIQRGLVTIDQNSEDVIIDINISLTNFTNVNKMIVLLDTNSCYVYTYAWDVGFAYNNFAVIDNLTVDELTLKLKGATMGSSFVSYQVIEFY